MPQALAKLAAATTPAAADDPADLSAVALLNAYAAKRLSPVEIDARRARPGRAPRARNSTRSMRSMPRVPWRTRRHRPGAGRQGEALPLDGVPVTIKENIATKGTPVPLGTAARDARAGGRGRAAGGAAARGRRDHLRQDDDAGLRHAVLRAVELPSAGPQPVGPDEEPRRLARRARAPRRRRATGRSTSAPTSAARSGCRPAGAASSA